MTTKNGFKTWIVCPSYCYKIFHPLISVICQEYPEFFRLHLFDEVCDLTQKSILLFGYQHVANLDHLLQENHVCVYNLEQLICGKWDPYLKDLVHVHEIWDYSNLNIEYLQKYFPHLNTRYVPIGFSPFFQHPPDPNITNSSDRCAFIGNLSPRRKSILNQYGDWVDVFTYHYFEELEAIVRRFDIFMNLHFYESPTILETTRIVPLLANRKIVLSERSNDLELDEMVRGNVIYHELSSSLFQDRESLTFSEEHFQTWSTNHPWTKYLNDPVKTIKTPKMAIATLHCNDRTAIFEVIQRFVEETSYRDFVWVILSQGCSFLHNQTLKEILEQHHISNHIIELETNLGWSKGLNRLYQYLQDEAFELVFHLEDDWLCVSIDNPKWLFECCLYLQVHPEVSTLFLRRYTSQEDKYQYGWTRNIYYKCFQHPNPFNYSEKMKNQVKTTFKSLTLQPIPEFLYSANPTLFRLSDYIRNGVFPFPEFDDASQKHGEWAVTTTEDNVYWGFAEAISMEKIRHLICMNVNRGFFFHRG